MAFETVWRLRQYGVITGTAKDADLAQEVPNLGYPRLNIMYYLKL